MNFNIKYIFTNGTTKCHSASSEDENLLILSREFPSGVTAVEIHSEDFTASARDIGYFVIPNVKDENLENNGHAALTLFRERPDIETVFPDNVMPIYGICRDNFAILAIVSGMSLDYSLICGVKDGAYYLYPRFILNGEIPYENIKIKFFRLNSDSASYSGIARRYRRYQLERGACIPLRERMRDYPVLKEAAMGHEVRLRMGWKPVPPSILEQTEENEPPMHVAITFERAEAIIEEFHRQGIKNAEFCLVGWNKSGHDGRWPDIFPVEPRLGGENALRHLIAKAKSYGYLICAHTNTMDSYLIARRFDRDDLLLHNDGTIEDGGSWGGGQSYRVCARAVYRKNAEKDFGDIKQLGFYGTHYLDVMSILRPEKCCNPKHPANRRETGDWRGKILRLAREHIGASGSEGCWDFCVGSLDYVLYTVFHPDAKLPDICDRTIPLWHLVYHGIVLYNTSCNTVNSAVNPDRKAWLENIEYGGRPLVYFYSKFTSNGNNWMGEIDCGCETDEELYKCVSGIKKEYDEYKRLRHLQFEFMEEYEELAPGVMKTSYSDGSFVLVNYNDQPYSYLEFEVGPLDFIVVNG